MTMEFKPGRHVSRCWYVGVPGRDWLAFLFRDEGGPWHVLYRFRYGEGGEGDKRSWYEFSSTGDEVTVAATISQTAEMTRWHFETLSKEPAIFACEVLNTDDEEVILDALSKHAWFHVEPVPLPDPHSVS